METTTGSGGGPSSRPLPRHKTGGVARGAPSSGAAGKSRPGAARGGGGGGMRLFGAAPAPRPAPQSRRRRG